MHSPMHSTMMVIKEGVKNNLYTSSVEFGMVTQRPTEDTDGWMVNGCNLEDYIDVDVGFLDDWRVGQVGGWIVNELIDDKDDICAVVFNWIGGW